MGHQVDAGPLEREAALRVLGALLAEVASGGGRTVLTSGESGIGKTSLVRCLLERHASARRVLWGVQVALHFAPCVAAA